MSPGFLIQCDANGHVSYMRKKSSKSNSNFSLKRMQCSIFSNTVYKAELHRWYWGESAKADPSLKQWQASCIFTTAPFQSILMVQTLLCADLITLHIKRKKKIKKKYIFACQRGIHSGRFCCFPNIQMAAPALLFNFVLQMWERCPI